MDSLSLLQGIFPTHGLNPGLSHCRRILYQLSHKGSPVLIKTPANVLSVLLYKTGFHSHLELPEDLGRVKTVLLSLSWNWALPTDKKDEQEVC